MDKGAAGAACRQESPDSSCLQLGIRERIIRGPQQIESSLQRNDKGAGQIGDTQLYATFPYKMDYSGFPLGEETGEIGGKLSFLKMTFTDLAKLCVP